MDPRLGPTFTFDLGAYTESVVSDTAGHVQLQQVATGSLQSRILISSRYFYGGRCGGSDWIRQVPVEALHSDRLSLGK